MQLVTEDDDTRPVPPPIRQERRRGRRRGWGSEADRVWRQARIAEAVGLRKSGHTYRQIAETMNVAPGTASTWCKEGFAAVPRDLLAEEAHKLIRRHCDRLMEQLDARLAHGDLTIVDEILEAQARLAASIGLDLEGPSGSRAS